MKRWIAAAALALTFAFSIAAAPAALAAKCKCDKGHAKMWSKLGVSEEAQAKIKDLHEVRHAAKKEWKGQWKTKHAELHALLTADPLDQSKIDAVAAELATLKANKVKAKVDHKSKVAALLTAEQRAKAFQVKAHKKGKKKHGKCSCGG